MKGKLPGGHTAPWPTKNGERASAAASPVTRPCENDRTPAAGTDGAAITSYWSGASHQPSARDGTGGERIARLTEARDQLIGVLATLDEHSRSPAAATVDMAIHQINSELDR